MIPSSERVADENATISKAALQSLRGFQVRSWRRGLIQMLNTIGPYLLLWTAAAAVLRLGLPYWVALLVTVPAAFFMVRTFILFHDCCHGSFLPGRRANKVVGFATGLLTFTPFESWRQDHLKHHATNAQLDHRGVGDVWTMTCDEYASAGSWMRFAYRLYRLPFVIFVLGPLLMFLVSNRVSGKGASRRERIGVGLTNLGILSLAAAGSLLLGLRTYLLVQVPILWIAGTIGIWLFYVQHQFDPGYWARDNDWDRIDAAFHGASYYRLPAALNWLTGSIGLHHLHHLLPGIPNYMLSRALDSTPEATPPNPLTFRQSLSSIRMNLWHESSKRFVSFSEARRMASVSAN